MQRMSLRMTAMLLLLPLAAIAACAPLPEQQPPEATPPPPPAAETDTTPGPPEERMLIMEAHDFFFRPDAFTVRQGQRVTITFPTVNGMHDFVIDALNVRSDILSPGDTVIFTPQRTGTFPYYCSIPGHREQGMVGTLTVTE